MASDEITPAELLKAVSASSIVATVNGSGLCLFVAGKLAGVLPPGEIAVTFSEGPSGTHEAPTKLHASSTDGPGPTMTLSVAGLTPVETDVCAEAVRAAFDRAATV